MVFVVLRNWYVIKWEVLKLICTILKCSWNYLKLTWIIWNSLGNFWNWPGKGVVSTTLAYHSKPLHFYIMVSLIQSVYFLSAFGDWETYWKIKISHSYEAVSLLRSVYLYIDTRVEKSHINSFKVKSVPTCSRHLSRRFQRLLCFNMTPEGKMSLCKWRENISRG